MDFWIGSCINLDVMGYVCMQILDVSILNFYSLVVYICQLYSVTKYKQQIAIKLCVSFSHNYGSLVIISSLCLKNFNCQFKVSILVLILFMNQSSFLFINIKIQKMTRLSHLCILGLLGRTGSFLFLSPRKIIWFAKRYNII